MRNETPHETNKNNYRQAMKRQGMIERDAPRDAKARRKTRRHRGNEQSVIDKENQAPERKNIKSPHSSPDPLIACSPLPAGLI